MDLRQTKLTRAEWQSVEIPVDESELTILQMIVRGYHAPHERTNHHLSLYDVLKIQPSKDMDDYLFRIRFEKQIRDIVGNDVANHVKEWLDTRISSKQKPKKPSTADTIRIENTRAYHAEDVFENILIQTCIPVIVHDSFNSLYALLRMRELSVRHVNPYVLSFVDMVIGHCPLTDAATIRHVYEHSYEYIEKNILLSKYQDNMLYSHQSELFELFPPSTTPSPRKLVLYMAPTGTGKTMSPLGLSEGYRVIFVCVARHVGLALARSAISVNKRVAFAFGAETSDDIRLHYFAAADYSVNKRSGGIGKVDNSNGRRVEIMICDVASYLVAMYYMKSFHNTEKIITYWDEPTISMDYDDHELHPIISKNWKRNQIPNIVLSCATLPRAYEIAPILHDYRARFTVHRNQDANEMEEDEEEQQEIMTEIHTTTSYDCKKTITLLNKEGKVVLPHFLFRSYRELIQCVEHCEENRSLLRYFDVSEIIRFVIYMEQQEMIPLSLQITQRFRSIRDVHLLSIKLHYLDVLREIVDVDEWPRLFDHFAASHLPRFGSPQSSIKTIHSVDSSHIFGKIQNANHSINQPSVPLRRLSSLSSVPSTPATANASSASASDGILLTTRDAHTLTDGPTIYLAEDVVKIGKFLLQQSRIPVAVLDNIQRKIDRNDAILQEIRSIERTMAELESSNNEDKKKTSKDKGKDKDKLREANSDKSNMTQEQRKLNEKITDLREHVQPVRLNAIYVPNTVPHQEIWLPANDVPVRNAFVSNVDDEDVRDIMGLQDVDHQTKLLLMLGIGVFDMAQTATAYVEIMKRLAYKQALFIIIASSDYIYGTNYQFCHGFLGKDLTNMTQQKIIQAIGRVGRNSMQQEYTIRVRDDQVLRQLFMRVEENREARIMTRLFCGADPEEEEDYDE